MKRNNLLFALSLAGALSLWLGRFQDPLTVLAGFIALFLVLRGVSIRDVLIAAVGAAAALFLLPIGLWGAMAAFALVQLLAELRARERFFKKDRFRESQKTAERILSEGARLT